MPTPSRPSPLFATTALLTGLAALVAAPATSQAGSASSGHLRPTAVRTDAVAQPGGALAVRVVLSATGEVGQRTGVVVYLSADAKRSANDTRLRSTVKTPRFAARSKATFTATVKLPTDLPLRTVRVIACVNESVKGPSKQPAKDCRTAKAPLQIVAAVGPSATPKALIAADLAAGRIKPDQALGYRALAVFGDQRLPAKYSGGAAAGGDDSVMRELASAWGTLSAPVKKQVGKYFLPTPLRDATPAELKAGGAKRRPTKGTPKDPKPAQRQQDGSGAGIDAEATPEVDPSVCDTEYFKSKSWQSRAAAGGKIRIHWRTDRPEDGKDAASIASDLTAAYAKYKTLLGREPLPDSEVDCYHGPDGALDVYVDRVIGKSAITVPSTQATGNQADCEGYPGFIVTNPTDATLSMRFVLAHELFHVFQMSYSYHSGCKDYAWFDEGSANWAAHTVFPTDDSEHLWDGQLIGVHNDVADEYYSWVFTLWIEQTLGADKIRKTFEQFEAQGNAVHAVDAAIGTWRKHFLDFAKHGWNQAPYASFASWDRLAAQPRPHYQDVTQANLFLAGQPTRTAYAEFAVDTRGRDYRRYPVTDDKIREIVFKNDLAGNPDARIGAILTLRGGQTRFEDWSGQESVKLCRDEAEDDVTEIVLVYANSKLDDKWATGGQITGRPELALRDTCDTLPWHYKILSASLKTHLDGQRAAGTGSSCLAKGYDTRDQVDFTAGAGPQPFDPEQNVVKQQRYGDALEARFQAKAPGAKWEHLLTGCERPYQPPTSFCQQRRTEQATGDWTLGFSLRASSRKAPSATLTWYVGSIIGGYFDADDSVCNVFTISNIIEDDAVIESQVALETLERTTPFTLTLNGDTSWDRDSSGKPVRLTYSWDYAITLQRVAPDGSPLTS